MHLSDGDIRAFLDDELAAPQRQAAQQHLATCPDCQTHADALLARAQFAQQRLAAMTKSTSDRAPASTLRRAAGWTSAWQPYNP